MTFSIDPRTELDLTPLWYELERRETEAWEKAGKLRPLRQPDGRLIEGIPVEDQPYKQCWWLTADRSLIGSPYRQIPENTPKDQEADHPGSLLTASDVKSALFLVFDPSVQVRVVDQHTGKQANLLEVVADSREGDLKKYLLSARWAAHEPMPVSDGAIPWSAIFPCALHAMAARTFGVKPREALVQAMAFADQMNLVQLPGGFAVVTASGSFLLDAGSAVSLDFKSAKRIFFDQVLLADRLDALQHKVQKISKEQRALHKTGKKLSDKMLLVQQQQCSVLVAHLAALRGALNRPLATREAGLLPFKRALSQCWNVETRISELAEQVEWLQSSARTTAELRMFRLGRTIATFTLPLIVANTFANSVSGMATRYLGQYLAGLSDSAIYDISLGFLLVISFLIVHLTLWRDR